MALQVLFTSLHPRSRKDDANQNDQATYRDRAATAGESSRHGGTSDLNHLKYQTPTGEPRRPKMQGCSPGDQPSQGTWGILTPCEVPMKR